MVAGKDRANHGPQARAMAVRRRLAQHAAANPAKAAKAEAMDNASDADGGAEAGAVVADKAVKAEAMEAAVAATHPDLRPVDRRIRS